MVFAVPKCRKTCTGKKNDLLHFNCPQSHILFVDHFGRPCSTLLVATNSRQTTTLAHIGRGFYRKKTPFYHTFFKRTPLRPPPGCPARLSTMVSSRQSCCTASVFRRDTTSGCWRRLRMSSRGPRRIVCKIHYYRRVFCIKKKYCTYMQRIYGKYLLKWLVFICVKFKWPVQL